jgi:hypothetical protein
MVEAMAPEPPSPSARASKRLSPWADPARAARSVPPLSLLAAAASGCVALPFGTPPMTVSVSPGVALGKPLPREAAPAQPAGRVLIEGRAAVQPLALAEGWQDRRFDASAGYLCELFPREDLLQYTHHGAFIGLTHYPWMSISPEGDGGVRLGVTAMPELLVTENDRELGAGMTFDLALETFGYVSSNFAELTAEGGYLGGAMGEGGIGLNLGAGVRGIGEMRYWSLHLGLVLRIPASGGIVAVPIWELADALD